MNWPTHTDYQDAIQNPQICFAEADLKAGEPKCDMLGLPRVMSGNFASVYELSKDSHRWAVRCFVRQVMGQQGRYARLCQHLGGITLPWLVNFDYFLKGILVRGEWYPIVKMQWVEGSPINTWVDENVNDAAKLRAAAAQWRTLVNDMRKHSLAHGDYQHGNIMVTTQDELRLVDYDGMYCPAFGKGRSPELGHANFQHPRRLPEHYDDTLDNFSALVIYVSLLALAEEPALWKEFYTGDNLLLVSADYKNPQNSKAFARLQASPNAQVKQIASLLQQCCMRSITDVPWFEETVAAAEAGTLEAQVKAMPEPNAASSWLEDAAAGAAVEGSRSAQTTQMSRPSPPAPALSRPSPPAPAMSRPSPTPLTATSGPLGTRISPPHPTPTPKPTPAPGPAQMATPSGATVMLPRTAPAQSEPQAGATSHGLVEERSGPSRFVLVIGAIVILSLLIYIFSSKKQRAPALEQPAAAETQ